MLLHDPAIFSWKPWLDAIPEPGMSFTVASSIVFFNSKNALGPGPSMLPYENTRQYIAEASKLEIYGCKDIWTHANPDFFGKIEPKNRDMHSDEDWIYFVRNLIHFGYYEDVSRHLAFKSAKKNQSYLVDWIDFVELQVEFIRSAAEGVHPVSPYFLNRMEKQRSEVALLGAIIYLSSLAVRSRDRNLIEKELKRFECAFAGMEFCKSRLDERLISQARFLKCRSAVQYRSRDISSGTANVDLAIELLGVGKGPFATPYELLIDNNKAAFWKHEAARRICHFAAKWLLDFGELNLARSYAEMSLSLDPYCAQAILMQGIILSRLGHSQQAKSKFYRAYCYGPIEKQIITSKGFKLEFQNKFVDLTYLLAPHKLSSYNTDKTSVSSFPFDVESANITLTEVIKDNAKSENEITQSETYKRFPQYWRIVEGFFVSADNPTFAYGPIAASKPVKNSEDVSFKTLYPQHCFREGFRDQLIFAAKDTLQIETADKFHGGKLDDFVNENAIVLEKYLSISSATNLEAAWMARLFAYLGFVEEGYNILIQRKTNCLEDSTYLYLQYTKIFIAHLRNVEVDIEAQCDGLWKEAPLSVDNLRTLLSVSILAGVQIARVKKNKYLLKKWVGRSDFILKKILNCESFSSFEKTLLHSHQIKFISFLPFLSGDVNEALLQINRLKEVSSTLCPSDEHETVLWRDNWYAVSETIARTLLYAGRNESALETIATALETYDPTDPRLTLQLGEYLQRNGEEQGARDVYLHAGQLGPPYRMISYFKAGICYEKAGELDEAVSCFLNSLRSYPLGISPIVRLERIAAKRNDQLLTEWASCRLSVLANRADTTIENRRKLVHLNDDLEMNYCLFSKDV